MGYNKKILSEATKKLNKPQKIKNKNTAEVQNTFPIISSEGFLNGPPPPGANYRIPGNSIYNPTPYNILARGSNGQEKIIAAGDRSVQNFGDADYVDEFEIAKKGGEKKYSRSLSATNKLFKKNPLVKGKKKKNKKTFDPNAKYYQDGGELPEDYQTFLDYSTTAPENRRPDENYVYGNPNDYDHYGMWQALGKPKDFDEALKMNPDWEPDPYDNMYHGFSVNPYTGVFLKSGKPGLTPGDTTWMEIAGHYLSPRAMMDTPVYDPEIQRFRYVPNDKSTEAELTPEEIEEYKKGGYIVEYLDDPSVPKLTQAQTGQNFTEEDGLEFYRRGFKDMVEVDYKTPNSQEIFEYSPDGSVKETIKYYDFPNIDTLPIRPSKPIDINTSKVNSKPLIDSTIIKRYNPQTNSWISNSVPVNSISDKYNQEREEWKRKNLKKQDGGQTSCPEGYTWDGKKCTITNPDLELQSVDVSANTEKNKERIKLVDRLQQVKGAYQDWREDAGLRRTRLRNEGASTIEGLKREIAEYKKQLDEEKKMYDKAGKALNVLKKQRPDEWKNAKIGDVLSTKGIEALRSLYSENKISDQTFRDFYNNFGSEYDPNVAKGKGPDRAYSAKEAEKDWMYDAPGFANMVNKFAMAAPLVGGLAALAPSVVETYGTLQASPFMQALGPAYRAPIAGIPGATAANFVRSIFLGETLSRIGDPIKSLKGAYSGEIDPSQAALDVTEYVTEVAMMGLPMMSIRNAATDLVKVADAPISKLIAPAGKWLQKNVPLTGKITSELEKIGELAPTITPIKLPNKIKPFVPSLNVPSLKDLSTADILRTETVLSTLKNAPENYTAVQKNIDLAIDPNASSADRLRALASAGNTSAANLLSMTPLFRKTAPLYNSRLAHALFLANNAIADDWRHSKTPLNISRLLTRQEGGSTSYVTELSNKKIKELERQGYKVEYLD